MGQLLKRGRIWWIRYYVNGHREEESARTTVKEDARNLLKQREGDVAKGAPLTAKVGRLRFRAFRWRPTARRSTTSSCRRG